MPPKVRVIRRGETAQDRAAQRQIIGPLRTQLISSRASKRYAVAVDLFIRFVWHFLGQALDVQDLALVDSQLVSFLEALWSEGDPRQVAADAICGLQHHLNRRRIFTGAWRFHSAWTRAELPSRVPPLPQLVLAALAGSLIQAGELSMAVAIVTGFHCFLRTAELLGATSGDVTWSARGRGCISLPLTKSSQRTGAPEFVTVEDAVVAKLLQHFLQGCARTSPIFRGSVVDFRRLCKSHLARLGLSDQLYQPYSLRRGGATQHFIDFGHLASTQHRGRWGSYKACRVYVVEGRRELQGAALDDSRALLHVFAQVLKDFASSL